MKWIKAIMKIDAVLIVLLIGLLPFAWGDSITGSTLIDFETGSDGQQVTSGVVSNATHGLVYKCWIASNDGTYAPSSSSALTISTSAQKNLYTPANISGTLYPGTGTRGLRATCGGNEGFIVLQFPAAQYPLSVGFYWRHTGALSEFHQRDLVCFNSYPPSSFQFFSPLDNLPNTGNLSFMAHWCYSGQNRSGAVLAINKWYWVTMLFARQGETFRVRMYDADTQALIGERTGVISDCSPSGANIFCMGLVKYQTGTAIYDFDNLIINTQGVFPLGPGNGGGFPVNQPPVVVETKQ